MWAVVLLALQNHQHVPSVIDCKGFLGYTWVVDGTKLPQSRLKHLQCKLTFKVSFAMAAMNEEQRRFAMAGDFAPFWTNKSWVLTIHHSHRTAPAQ